jgi:DNA-binding NarL/FixJ family response regulator
MCLSHAGLFLDRRLRSPARRRYPALMARLRRSPRRLIEGAQGKASHPQKDIQQLQPYEVGLEPPPLVTPREQDVLRLLADDLNCPEIGERLNLSPWTVRKYAQRLRWRSGKHTHQGLVAWAFRRGLVN